MEVSHRLIRTFRINQMIKHSNVSVSLRCSYARTILIVTVLPVFTTTGPFLTVSGKLDCSLYLLSVK